MESYHITFLLGKEGRQAQMVKRTVRAADMGTNKKYDGYKPYQYLEAGKDYIDYPVSAGDRRVEEHLVELTPQEEARVQELAERFVFIDAHSHPFHFPRDIEQDIDRYMGQGRMKCAYEELSRSYFDGIFDNLMDGTCSIVSKNGWKFADVIYDIGMRLCDLAHQDLIIRCEKIEDFYRAKQEGKIALVLVLEGATPIENELDRIDILYGLGVRQMGVTYSESNMLGCGIKEEKDSGLTIFGKQAIERMNKVGMLIDVSHCGPVTALESILYSKKPTLISHTGAKALWNSKRLMSDEILKACAERGGVIGVEAAPHTTMTKNFPLHSMESVFEHFEYIRELCGIDHVTFGVDASYGDHVGVHHYYATRLGTKAVQGTGFQEVPYVRGMENPTEASKNILRYLVKKGYSDEDIEKVLGGNVMRVLKENWE